MAEHRHVSVDRTSPSRDELDSEFVKRCVSGDSSAFAPLVERYQRVLFTVAVRMLGDPDEAADASQDAFVKAYQQLRTFDPSRRFFSWIYRILVNECLNVRRARRPYEPVADLRIAGTPADLLEANERRQRVKQAVLALPVEYREVIVLRHFTGLSYDEIAATLGVSSAIVKSRLYTARQRLGTMLLGWRPQE